MKVHTLAHGRSTSRRQAPVAERGRFVSYSAAERASCMWVTRCEHHAMKTSQVLSHAMPRIGPTARSTPVLRNWLHHKCLGEFQGSVTESCQRHKSTTNFKAHMAKILNFEKAQPSKMCTNQDSFLTQIKAALCICGTRLDDKLSRPLPDHDDFLTKLTLTHAARQKRWTCLFSPTLSPSDLSGFMWCCLCFQSDAQTWILTWCRKHKHVHCCIVESVQLCCPFVFAQGQKGKLILV